MTFICYIESDVHAVPHMEPLATDCAETARLEAQALLANQTSGIAAHVFRGDERLFSIRSDELAT